MSFNQATIVGNLGRDPESKHLNSGDVVTNFSVATSERWKDKQSGEMREKTEWHRVALFGRVAEIARDFLRKGSKVLVQGKLQTRSYRKEGESSDRYSTEINVSGFQGRLVLLDKKEDGPPPQQQTQQTQSDITDPELDVPF